MRVGQHVTCRRDPSLGVGEVVEQLPSGRVRVAFDHAVNDDGTIGTGRVRLPSDLHPISDAEARGRLYAAD